MSVFTPYKLAPLVGKSGKQIGRYCEAGCFGQRAIKTPGGHWRIAAPSLRSAAAFIRQHLPAKTRQAGGGKERERQRSAARLVRSFAAVRVGLGSRWGLIEAAGQRAEGEQLGEDVFQQLERGEGVPGGLQTLALAGWMFAIDSNGGRVTQAAVARAANMSRSTFLRKHGGLWRVAARFMAAQLTRGGSLYVTRAGHGGGYYAESVEMPCGATDEELRRWGGACRIAG